MVKRIGVLGAGHLGSIHIKCILASEHLELAGFYDPDEVTAENVARTFRIPRFHSEDELMSAADIMDIVTPTVSHFDCASRALKQGKHVFIEKPLTATLEEGRKLIELAREASVKVQVGHVERFNPAFIAAEPYLKTPMFIEAHRLGRFNPRGTDVPVVLDLMIHDIDIILNVVKAKVKQISASGASIVSDTPDIASARIEFTNGCVANLTASRLSMKNMRKTRFFQQDGYIAVDFLSKETQVIRLKDVVTSSDPMAMVIDVGPEKKQKQIWVEKPEVEPINAIQTELETFLCAITGNTDPLVSIHDGYASLDLANRIMGKIQHSANYLG
ncbi:MAG: Gfo/Idh/MocA family protein [Bacteroidales bacterium]